MKQAIATLAIGEGILHRESLASYQHAASRWNADLVIFGKPLAECHPWWQKTFAIDHLQQYDHVYQIDADMLIAADCPSPFEACDPTRLGVCRDLQHQRQYPFARWLSETTRSWAIDLRLEQPGGRQCVNAGMLLYGPRQLLPWFRLWRFIGRSRGFPCENLGDQPVLCVLLRNFQFHTLLPDRWNYTHAGTTWRPDLPRQMSGSVYHFCGYKRRIARIESTLWRSGRRPAVWAETAHPPPAVAGRFADRGTAP